jgi:hypothetical protein
MTEAGSRFHQSTGNGTNSNPSAWRSNFRQVWRTSSTKTLAISEANQISGSQMESQHSGGGLAGARPRGPGDPGLAPSQLELARAAQKALALALQDKSTWTRTDLIKYLGRVLPRTGTDPAAAAALLEDVADRTLRSEF